MLNFGWAEMMVIGVVALIVIGPEDLPDMFRQLGRFTAKLRSMSREFSRAMEQAAKDTGVKDVAKDLNALTTPKAMGLDAVKSAADKFEKWDPIKSAAKPVAKPLTPAPIPATPKPIVIGDTSEAAADMAEHGEPVTSHGPATQALYDKKAAREAVLREQAAKLKAIDEGTYVPDPAPVAKPVWKSPAQAKADAAAAKVAEPVAPAADSQVTEGLPKAPRKPSRKKKVDKA